MVPKPRGTWISIDGTNGVGKTTVAHHLVHIFRDSVLAPEFSDSSVGQYLSDAVNSSPFYISQSLMEQSLLFLADFYRIYDLVIQPTMANGGIIISDRGYINKYVWQFIVLSNMYGESKARTIMEALFSIIILPDLTLFLICKEEVQAERLQNRDGLNYYEENRVGFIRQANKECRLLLETHNCHHVCIDQDSSTTKEELLYKAERTVREFLGL